MPRKRSPRRMIPEGERQTPVSKAIGSPDLDSSGKLYPKKLPGESGVLPEEKDPKLPTDGLIVSPALMAEAVLDGRKTLIVKTRPFEIAGKRYLLIGDRKALGVVTLGKLRDVDLDELKRTADQHLISEEVRTEWAKARKGWKKGPFYGWTVAVESKFDEPVETNIGPDPQVLARDVELKSVEKQIRTDPSHLFFCARLPDEIRKKLTDMSSEILKGVDHAEADDADHITVLYVPSKGEYSESDKKDALSAIQKVLDGAKPIDAKFQGWGIFDGASRGGEPATALVALVDAPGLAELHTEIKAAMSKAGFTEVDDQTHGFVPHATLAYLPVGARVEKLPVLDAEFKIEKIELVHSDISELDLRGAEKRVINPPEAVVKRVKLAPDLDAGALTTAELREAHWVLHSLFRGPAEARGRTGFSVEDASNLHALVVDELFERKAPHPPPPGDGLDDVSGDFERYEEKQPDYDVPPWERDDTAEKQEARIASPELRKQADPYMEIPNEDKAPYDYTVQEHFRGKSLHCDLRIGYRPGKLLIGWTMNTQIAGEIKEPVTTLKQAQQLAKTRMDRYSKINWNTGDWAERPKKGTTKLVRTSILCERKAPAPWAWIDVEGKTKDPEPGKPPPVGGTKNFPGVFNIVDRGEVEFGSQKPQFHEYFFIRGDLKGRLIFRQLRILPAKKGTYSRSQCMHEGCRRAPDVDVLWADGRGRVWFCTEHLAAWKQQFEDEGKEDWLDIVGEKTVTSGEVPEKWSDVHKADDVIVSKEVVLPPSEEQDLPGPSWLAIKPDDLTPYVLDSAAVKKDWMPPVGVSALPRAIRAQIPEEYHYWEKKTAAGAKQARDALVLAIKAKDIEIDYSAPYGRTTTKASMTDARFVLQEQIWRGPVQIRTGPSRTLWHLRLDVGRPELIVAEMYLDPLDNKRLAARVTDDPHKDSMKLRGVIKSSHYLNPTKTTPSSIEIVDSGKASVLAYSDKFLKVRLNGELLEGVFEAKRSDGDWLWQPSEPGQRVEKEAGDMADEYRAEFTAQAMIVKTDKEKRLVTGVVLEPDTVDAQKDTIDTEAIERAAHKFLAQYNRETQLGVLHTIFGENGIDLVESWTAKTDFKLGDENVSEGTWLMTVKVLDDVLWKKVKSGEITGFSIGGIATVI